MAAAGEFGAERTQDDPIEGAALVDEQTPDEYQADERSGGQSPDTGVTYDRSGEPEATPHDIELTEVEEDTP